MQNPKYTVIGHLNVNSLRQKLEAVAEPVQNMVDVCFFSEKKVDEAVPTEQFMINGFKLFRRDRNCHGGHFVEGINVEGIEKDCEIL